MKKVELYLAVVSVALLSIAANAEVVMDLGAAASGTSGGNYNDIYGETRADIAGDYTLVDFDTGLAAGSLSLSANNMAGGWADSGNGYTGAKPASLAGYAATALDDGLFINNGVNPDPVLTFAFSGLLANKEYEFLVYGARSNQGEPLYADLAVGTLGSGADMDILSTLNNTSDTISFIATSTAGGLLTVDFGSGSAASSAAQLNFISVAAIPEPATLGLVAAFGGGILFVRRRLML